MSKVDKAGVARRVRARRERLGISQARLAEASNMSQQGVDNIEQGKVGRPRQLLELAESLQTTPEWLLHERGPETIVKANPLEEIAALARMIGPEKLGLAIQFLRSLRDDETKVA